MVLLTSALAVKFDTRMQLRFNTLAEAAGLFKLHPMAVINLHCIPTLVVFCRDAAKIDKSVVVLKEETRTSVTHSLYGTTCSTHARRHRCRGLGL